MSNRPKHILLGIGGGIAAYKSAEVVRLLRAQGAEVRVVMTRAAQAFMTPLSFQALSGHPVATELFAPGTADGMDHIALARWADQVLIAPGTADLMARLATGLGDDLLTTLLLATAAPVALAPAMNAQMWHHPATQANRAVLQQRGVRILGPAEGEQACGEIGLGRMLEPEILVRRLLGSRSSALAGRRVLMTSGPTREAIDPVRYLTNRSSGRMGIALARALMERGARVTLVSGPTCLPMPEDLEVIRVESAREMEAAVMERIETCAIFIGVAAVADYRPADPAPRKIKKAREHLTLHLVRNPDILARVAGHPNRPFTVGFAAETEALELQARRKLEAKKLDMIAANPVGGPIGGFESEENQLLVLWPGGGQSLPLGTKAQLADALVDRIEERYVANGADTGAR